MTEQTNLIELRALKVLETYDGANNYILRLQSQKKQNPKFYPTRAQSEYIINFKDTKPKVGKRWVEINPYFAKKIADGRQQQGIDFFMQMINAPIPKIAVENPIGIMSRIYRKPNQIIQPYQYGHEASKSTCLWLKELPLLKPTNIVGKGKVFISSTGKKYPAWSHDAVGKNGKKVGYNTDEMKKIRNKTFKGIAEAMAQQWG